MKSSESEQKENGQLQKKNKEELVGLICRVVWYILGTKSKSCAHDTLNCCAVLYERQKALNILHIIVQSASESLIWSVSTLSYRSHLPKRCF